MAALLVPAEAVDAEGVVPQVGGLAPDARDIGVGVLAELPGGPVARPCVLLEALDLVVLHALEIIVALVVLLDVQGAVVVELALMPTAHRRLVGAGTRAIG